MRAISKLGFALIAVLMLFGCATDPLPDYRYYRSAPSAAVDALAAPLLAETVEVAFFRADGVLGERPIVYSYDDEPQKLSQYHYQLWTDPPGAWIQRRIVDLLGNYRISPLVSPRASPRSEPSQLTGTIERFERIKNATGGQWRVAVALRLRLEAHRASVPLLEKRYEVMLDVAGDTIANSVDSFGQAVDQITAQFVQDLRLTLANAARNGAPAARVGN
jgi:cholesterol transport system auxiliary component